MDRLIHAAGSLSSQWNLGPWPALALLASPATRAALLFRRLKSDGQCQPVIAVPARRAGGRGGQGADRRRRRH